MPTKTEATTININWIKSEIEARLIPKKNNYNFHTNWIKYCLSLLSIKCIHKQWLDSVRARCRNSNRVVKYCNKAKLVSQFFQLQFSPSDNLIISTEKTKTELKSTAFPT